MSDLYLECLSNYQSWNNSNHGIFHYPILEILQVFRPPPLHPSASRRILAPPHPKDQGKDGKMGLMMAKPSWQGGIDQGYPLDPSHVPILYPSRPEGNF